MFNVSKWLTISVLIAVLCGCSDELPRGERTSGFEGFLKNYNRFTEKWLLEEKEALALQIIKSTDELATAPEEKKAALETALKALEREQIKIDYRLGRGEYFQFSSPDKIPTDLIWEDGMEHEEIGDPRAIKGGTFRQAVQAFPPTIRAFGPNANNGNRGVLFDEIDIGLVGLHPKSMKLIPGLAKQWATSADGRTVYFKLDETATYSDGVSVKARDFLFGTYIRISDNIVNPYAKQYLRDSVAGVTVYDDLTLSVSLPEAQVYAPLLASLIANSPPHFYDDYGPDFAERYQWAYPPTTGAYEVKKDGIIKGVSITQSRVKDWWAKDKKYYQYRFNPDRVRHIVVRDPSKAFELFRAGELDYFSLGQPDLWYEKSMVDSVFNGYIERYTFFRQYPAIPRGLYLNTSKPLLDELDIRIGIQHAMNWQKVIDVVFRGDSQRLNAFNEGFLNYSDPSIRARPFSITSAREHFRKAGFTRTGNDGILMRGDGTRLSISVTYSAHPLVDKMLSILREEALSCGFELRLDSNEAILGYKKTQQKQHEMAFSGWMVTPPMPNYHQFIHSSNARDEKGNIKPETNNLFVWGREDTDKLSEVIRHAKTDEELREAAIKLQNIMHDEAMFVPGYTVNFSRVGTWRWVRWPDSKETRFSPPVIYSPTETHVLWIDEEMRKETLRAKRVGIVFPEVDRVITEYQNTISPKISEETEEEEK